MPDQEALSKLRKAGEIGASAIEYGRMLIKEGAHVLEVADSIEQFIVDNGALPAFPVNLSKNSVAAHFTPASGDAELLFSKGDVVKLDLGAHIDGYISDTAVTVEVGSDRWGALMESSRAALEEAISIMGPNANLSTIGGAIQHVIEERGFKPIQNLTGHLIEPYVLHAGISVPNVEQRSNARPRVGQVFAIEPFATTGNGRVGSGPGGNIYHFQRDRPQRMPDARAALNYIRSEHDRLPFAERWVAKKHGARTKLALNVLLKTVAIKSYPQLVESDGGMVSQHEHTVIITEDGCEVLTRRQGE